MWIYLRKEKFPNKKYAKFRSGVDDPFKIVKKTNDNAYKVEFPGEYGMSGTFNVSDFSPYHEDDQHDSRMTFFNQGRMMHGGSLMLSYLMLQ